MYGRFPRRPPPPPIYVIAAAALLAYDWPDMGWCRSIEATAHIIVQLQGILILPSVLQTAGQYRAKISPHEERRVSFTVQAEVCRSKYSCQNYYHRIVTKLFPSVTTGHFPLFTIYTLQCSRRQLSTKCGRLIDMIPCATDRVGCEVLRKLEKGITEVTRRTVPEAKHIHLN